MHAALLHKAENPPYRADTGSPLHKMRPQQLTLPVAPNTEPVLALHGEEAKAVLVRRLRLEAFLGDLLGDLLG